MKTTVVRKVFLADLLTAFLVMPMLVAAQNPTTDAGTLDETRFAAPARQDWPRARGGGTILAIRIDAAVDEDSFREEVDRMVQDVARTFEPFPGLDRALLPGTVEAERFDRYRREGIPFGDAEQAQVREVCERLDVSMPWN